MIIAEEHITLREQSFVLTNQRVLYWPEKNSLILSDLHVGKAATFRKHGIPISRKVLEDDLERLSQLIEHYQAEKLIIVGDLFHAEFNKDIAYFKDWLHTIGITTDLITGNHDRLSDRFYEELNINVYTREKILSSIRFVHDEIEAHQDYFTISGHTHPGVLIKGRGRQMIKLPCFQVTQDQLILPAFSKFTGLNTRNIPKNCVSYGFTDTTIVKI